MYEDLLSSSISICVEGPAAAAAMMSNLICYCSIAAIATVACICYIAYLPPTLFGCLAGVFFCKGRPSGKGAARRKCILPHDLSPCTKRPQIMQHIYYIYKLYILYICIIYILYYLYMRIYIYIYTYIRTCTTCSFPFASSFMHASLAGWSSKLTIQNLCLVTRSPFAFSWWQFLTPFRAFCNLMGSLLVIVEM